MSAEKITDDIDFVNVPALAAKSWEELRRGDLAQLAYESLSLCDADQRELVENLVVISKRLRGENR